MTKVLIPSAGWLFVHVAIDLESKKLLSVNPSLYQNKSINSASWIPQKRGNKLFSRFSVLLPLTNGVHYTLMERR